MNYGVGKFILASALYRKWAQSVVTGARFREKKGPYFRDAETIINVQKVVANVRSCPSMAVVQQALVITAPHTNRPRHRR